MADFNEDDDGSDLFGFVTADSSETKSGQGGVIPTGLEVPEGVFTGPNKDAVIFCIDCANIGDIMKGMTRIFVLPSLSRGGRVTV